MYAHCFHRSSRRHRRRNVIQKIYAKKVKTMSRNHEHPPTKDKARVQMPECTKGRRGERTCEMAWRSQCVVRDVDVGCRMADSGRGCITRYRCLSFHGLCWCISGLGRCCCFLFCCWRMECGFVCTCISQGSCCRPYSFHYLFSLRLSRTLLFLLMPV